MNTFLKADRKLIRKAKYFDEDNNLIDERVIKTSDLIVPYDECQEIIHAATEDCVRIEVDGRM